MSIRRNLDRRTLEEEHSRHFIKTTDFPTAHSVISSLRKVKNYNAGGLLPASISFNHFGSGTSANLGANGCLDAVKLVGQA